MTNLYQFFHSHRVLHGKLQVERAALSSLPHFKEFEHKFILILTENENKDSDPYNKLQGCRTYNPTPYKRFNSF